MKEPSITSDSSKVVGTTIPWIHGFDWAEAALSIKTTIAACGEEVVQLQKIAQDITATYEQIDGGIQEISEKSCTQCLDICCMRATVWYDTRDLIYLFLHNREFPDRQVSRTKEGLCSHLTTRGCKIERINRPFICTWYICSAQKKLMVGRPEIQKGIEKIQNLRKDLEDMFVTTCSR